MPEPEERKERSEVRKRRLQVEDFTQPQLQSLMTGAPTARKSFQLTSNAPMPSMRDEATSKGSLHRSLLQPSRASGELDTRADGFRGPDKLASHVDGFELRMDPGSKTGYYGVQYSNVLRSFLAFVRLDEASDEPGSSAAKTAAAELKPAGERSSSRLGSGGGSGDGGGDGGSKSPNEQAPCPHCGKCFVHGSKAIRNAHVECCAIVSGMTTTPARRKMHAKPSSTSSEDVSARSILLRRYPTAVEAAVALAHLAALCASKLTAPELWDCDDRDVGRLCKDAESILRPKEGEPAGPAAKRPKPSANAPELQAGACMACRHMKAPCRPCDDSEGRCSNCVRCGIDCFFEESPDPVGAGRSIAGLAPPAPTATPGAAARASVTVVPSAARASAKAVPQALPRRLLPSPKQQMKPWDKKKLTGWTSKEEKKFNKQFLKPSKQLKPSRSQLDASRSLLKPSRSQLKPSRSILKPSKPSKPISAVREAGTSGGGERRWRADGFDPLLEVEVARVSGRTGRTLKTPGKYVQPLLSEQERMFGRGVLEIEMQRKRVQSAIEHERKLKEREQWERDQDLMDSLQSRNKIQVARRIMDTDIWVHEESRVGDDFQAAMPGDSGQRMSEERGDELLWTPRGLGGSVHTDAKLDGFLERAAMLMDPGCTAPGGQLKPSALERALTALHAFGGDVDAACAKLTRTGAEEGGAAGPDRAVVAFERATRARRRLERLGRVGSDAGAEVDDVDGGVEAEGEDEDGAVEEEGEEEEGEEEEGEEEEGMDEGGEEGEEDEQAECPRRRTRVSPTLQPRLLRARHT